MTALPPPDVVVLADDAYEEFWHATEDDFGLVEVRIDEPEFEDVYSTYVEAIEA